jgi:hypothetical protein
MTATTSRKVGALREAMAGPVLEPGDAGFDEARSLWNGEFDRHPAVIARCVSSDDVVAAVGFGRETGMETTVRGGGHSFSGASACDGGFMIDLSRMNRVAVDPQRRRAVAGGGGPGPTSTRQPRHTASQSPAGSSPTPVSAASPSAVEWAG